MKTKNLSAFFISFAFLGLALSSCGVLPSPSSETTSQGGSSEETSVTSDTTSETSNTSEDTSVTSEESIPEDAYLVSIEITKQARNLDYKLNDQVDYTGLEVSANLSKGPQFVIPHEDLVFSGFSSLTAGEKTIKIEYTYKEVTKETSYKVTVYDNTQVKLDFYGFNDVHGNVRDSSLGIGIAKTSTLMKQATKNQNALLISSGDMWQGSLESNSNRGRLMTEWMRYLNFTSMTIGNHEFDWGTKCIKDISEEYSLPILGINVIDKATGNRADYVQPSTIVNRGGAKIGIIGAIGNCYSSISYSQVMDVEFVLDHEGGETPLTNLIKAESERLRNEEGCDFIVYSFHGDSYHTDTYYNVELSTGGYVDVVFEGHKHIETFYQDAGNVWHFQSAADGELAINHFSVNLNTTTDEYTVSFNESNDIYWLNLPVYQSLADDTGTVALINQYDFSQYYLSLGKNSTDRSGSQMRQLVADLYFDNGVNKWSQYANQIVLGGGYISIRGAGYLPKGDVTYAQLYNLFPFDNDLLLIQVSGTVLKNNFINNGNVNYYLKYSEYGNTLRNDQTQIYDGQQYYIICDTYSYDYLLSRGDGPIKVDVYSANGCYARDLLAEYAKAGGFNTGSGTDPEIEHTGLILDPYSVSDAYKLAEASPVDATWGYVRGIVKQAAIGMDGTAITNLIIKDTENDTEMSVYKLHKFDDDKVHGFSSVDEISVGSEIVIYGGFKEYNSAPGFGSVNMVVSVNGNAIAGDAFDNPISVFNYLLLVAQIGLEDFNPYVFGVIDNVVLNNTQTEIESFTLLGTHTVDFKSPANYYRGFSWADDITYTVDIPIKALKNGVTNVVIKINGDRATIVWSDADPGEQTEILHAGTLDDPYTVTDALLAAEKYTNQNDSPRVYCYGVVSRVGTAMGGSGDIKNVYIQDPNTGKEILIYYLRKYEGATKATNFQNPDDLQIGDEILINGQPFYYNNKTLEFGGNTYCVMINGESSSPQ